MPTIGELEDQIDEYVDPTEEVEEIEIAEPEAYHDETKIKEQMVAMTKQIFAEDNGKSFYLEMTKNSGNIIFACTAVIILCLSFLACQKQNKRQTSYVEFKDEDVI